MILWRRMSRRLNKYRNATFWAALMLAGTFLVLSQQPTETNRLSGTSRPPCRPDQAVNMLPTMPATDREMVLELFRYFTSPHPRACHKIARMGGGMTNGMRWTAVMDGHKFVCMDEEQLEIAHTDRCIVYSFGIKNDWTFDDDMADFGCTVFAFDPSINKTAHKRGDSIYFRPLGIGARDEIDNNGWDLRTLDTIASELGHEGETIHFLKMDVEGSEFAILGQQAMLGEHSTLARVEQLGIELHFLPHLPHEQHMDFYREVYEILLALQSLGFYLFSFEENLVLIDWVQVPGLGRNLTTAFEAVWLRSECARQAAGV